jgi:hypothetical protein
MEGRETGSAGQKKGQYLIDQYKKKELVFQRSYKFLPSGTTSFEQEK